jgi:putative transport protein
VDAEAIKSFIGPEVEAGWSIEDEKQPMVSRRIVVTNPKMNGKTLGKMHFSSVYGVNVTRITRQGMDLFASRNHHFHVGDRIMVVGPEDNVNRVAELMGNSVKRLDAPNIATIFIGIIIGILFGSLPFAIPGMPVPLKLGLAGGPLIIAILIGRFGYRIKLVTYTTTSANMMLREIGLVLFLASVGIKAGANFWDTVVDGDGLKYVLTGFLITIIPILIIGTIARVKFKFNYFTIMGMLAGTYTDPPALAYANSICSKEAPAIGYSTVYPLAMFLRIFTAQIIVLFFCG